MKKIIVGLLLILLSLNIIGCTKSEEKIQENPIITSLSDLQKTKKIYIKKPDAKEILYTIENDSKINRIIEIIFQSKKVSNDDNVPYIGNLYEMKMLDDNDILIENIKIYPSFISLEKLEESYFLNSNDIMDIVKN